MIPSYHVFQKILKLRFCMYIFFYRIGPEDFEPPALKVQLKTRVMHFVAYLSNFFKITLVHILVQNASLNVEDNLRACWE